VQGAGCRFKCIRCEVRGAGSREQGAECGIRV